MTLGEYERQLEQDKIMVEGLKAASSAISGIAQGIGGLGIGGGVLLAGLLWGKNLRELKDNLVELYPEGGAFLSPEWVAKWGANPVDETEDDQNQGDNDGVNELDPIDSTSGVHSFEGKSPYEVYSITATGRQAEYDYSVKNIIKDYTTKFGVGIYPGSIEEAQIISDWHGANPAPPPLLLNGQVAVQTNIRVTTARRNATYLRYFQNVNPASHPDFVKDNLLDWVAYNTADHDTLFNNTPKSPYNYIRYKARGEQLIAAYAWWSAPISAP